jgi:hypothetical protein
MTSTPHVDVEELKKTAEKGGSRRPEVLYPIFMPKPSTHHMHDPGSNVPHLRPKVLTNNQMS